MYTNQYHVQHISTHVHNANIVMHDYEYHAEKTVSDKNIFIPKQFTERAIYKKHLLEPFESTKQLFYYLRHRSNLAAIHGDLRVFHFINHIQSGKYAKGREMLIFCTDLHSKTGSEIMYIIGSKNTKNASTQKRIEKWKMSEFFLSAIQIYNKYRINVTDLPQGASAHLSSFNVNMHIQRLLCIKNTVTVQEYAALKCIKTKSSKANKQHTISKQKWTAAIQRASVLKQIISFSEDKCTYYIDMVLLVNIDTDNWIGVSFRNYDEDHYTPIDLVIDCYDLRNKMTLFQPPRNMEEYEEMHKYKNNISGLCIADRNTANKYNMNHKQVSQRMEALERRLFAANQRILSLQNMVCDKEKIIDAQSATMHLLKQQNNHYFEQCFNPKSSIIPHPIHKHEIVQAQQHTDEHLHELMEEAFDNLHLKPNAKTGDNMDNNTKVYHKYSNYNYKQQHNNKAIYNKLKVTNSSAPKQQAPHVLDIYEPSWAIGGDKLNNQLSYYLDLPSSDCVDQNYSLDPNAKPYIASFGNHTKNTKRKQTERKKVQKLDAKHKDKEKSVKQCLPYIVSDDCGAEQAVLEASQLLNMVDDYDAFTHRAMNVSGHT